MEQYQKLEKLGQGSYGIVYKSQHRQTDEIVALKRIRINAEGKGIPPSALTEISLLKELIHPNIVKLYDVIYSGTKLTLVFEYLDFNLKNFIETHGYDLDMKTIQYFMKQLLNGISFCHYHRVLHRDLKPQNVLINKKKELKIADFGLARTMNIPVRAHSLDVVTLWYRAPEILLGSKWYTTAIDIWSIGCIFAEMVTGHPLFPGQNQQDQLLQIFKILGTPDKSIWSSMLDLSIYSFDFPIYQPILLNSLLPKLDPTGLDLLKVKKFLFFLIN
jgi:cyclin-dependent kinase